MNGERGGRHIETYQMAQLGELLERVKRLEKLATNPEANTFKVGDGVQINKILSGSTSVNPGSIPATSTGTVTFTINGAALGDLVVLGRPAGLNDDLIVSGWRVTAANTVTIYLYNPTAGAIDDGANSWDWLWFDIT